MASDETPATSVGRYVQDRMDERGFKRKLDLADDSGVSPSTLSRMFRNPDYRPDIEVMRRLARSLQVGLEDLAAAVYGEQPAPASAALHPLAAELDRMLAADSPLSEPSRASLAELVDRVMEPHRREMRGGPAILVKTADGGTTAISKEGGKVHLTRQEPPATTLDMLASLLRDDSHISDYARRALRQLVDAALQLGEEAMLARDAKHGPTDAEVLERATTSRGGRVPQGR